MTSGSDSSITLRDGRRLSFRTRGDVTRPLLVYLGGLISSRLEVDIFFDDRFFVVGVDRPGYGRSDFSLCQTAESLAGYIAELLHHLGRDTCTIFGVSGGGAYAIGIAAARPYMVTAIGAFASISPYGTVDTTGCFIDEFPTLVQHPIRTWLDMKARCILYILPAWLLHLFVRFHGSKHILSIPQIRILKLSFREALRQGTRGLIQDLR